MKLQSGLARISLSATLFSTILLSGCVVAPMPIRSPVAHAGGVYVAPLYPIPAPGYAWVHHPRHGWGWHHHHHGWHRGWR